MTAESAGPQDDGITKAPGRHYCHPFHGKRFDETAGVPPDCTDVSPGTGVCGMCGTDTSESLSMTSDERSDLIEAEVNEMAAIGNTNYHELTPEQLQQFRKHPPEAPVAAAIRMLREYADVFDDEWGCGHRVPPDLDVTGLPERCEARALVEEWLPQIQPINNQGENQWDDHRSLTRF